MSGSFSKERSAELQRRGAAVSLAAAALLALHTGLLARLAWVHSPTIDETAHLPAGISHWTLGRFELYRVNPPFVRMVAALPVLVANPRVDWSGFSEALGARPEFTIGRDFIRANGASSFQYFTFARWACIPFSLLGGYTCYRWARSLWGAAAGLTALVVWCFDPNVLGNAQTIQPDVPAAAMAVTVAYFFWRWCRSPTLGKAVATGAVLGAALLTKTTLAFMLPLLPFLWLVGRGGEDGNRISSHHAVGQICLTMLIGLYVLNLGYVFDGSFRRLDQFQFVSETFRGETSSGNRFLGTLLGPIPVPLPKDYVLGIDEQKRDFEGRLRSYLRGETRPTGWWYFYLYAMLVKFPIGTWLLLGISAGTLMRNGLRSPGWRSVLFVAIPAIAFLAIVSSVTGMTHHLRYAFPAFPFLFILAGGASRKTGDLRPLARTLAAAISLLWMVGSSLTTFPHSHSYFNELVGGPEEGHFHLLSSNIDYGEDLFFLRDWLRHRGENRPLTLAYFGNFDPRIAGIDFSLPPNEPQPGLHAVSVNYLHGPSLPLPDGHGGLRINDGYPYFLEFEPIARAGYGIEIYDLGIEEVNRARERLRLPALRRVAEPRCNFH